MNQLNALEENPYLKADHTIRGRVIDERPDQSLMSDAWYQEGLEDAQRHLYDKHSFHRDRPLRAEEKAHARLEQDLAGALRGQIDDEGTSIPIVIGARAASAQAHAALSQVRSECAQVQADVDSRLATMTDPEGPLYVADVAKKSDPEEKPAFWTQRKVLLPLLIGAEALLGLWALYLFHESTQTTFGLAVVLTIATVLIPIYAGKILRGGGPLFGARKVAALSGLVLLVFVVAGSGWLRYLAAVNGASQTLAGEMAASNPSGALVVAKGADVATSDQVLSGIDLAMIAVFCFALPLCVSAVILLLEMKDHTSEITELRYLRTKLRDLREVLPKLEALCIQAQHAATSAEHNFDATVEKTKQYIQALPALIQLNYLAYVTGLAHGMGDPATTALLDDCAAAFSERFVSIADKHVEEYLDQVREPFILPAPASHFIDDHGNAAVAGKAPSDV